MNNDEDAVVSGPSLFGADALIAQNNSAVLKTAAAAAEPASMRMHCTNAHQPKWLIANLFICSDRKTLFCDTMSIIYISHGNCKCTYLALDQNRNILYTRAIYSCFLLFANIHNCCNSL